MGLQNVLTDPLFKRDETGRTVMYPNGAVGRGYILPDTATEARMRKALFRLIIASGLTGGAGSLALILIYGPYSRWPASTWMIAVASLLAIALAFRWFLNRLARGIPPSPVRLKASEALKAQARAMPRWYLWMIAVGGALYCAGGVGVAMLGSSVGMRLLGLAGAALFAVITAQGVYGLRSAGPPAQEAAQ